MVQAPTLEMIGIEKRFGPVAALAGVSFRVRPGRVHALVGENGAGKSTLMKILAGVHVPDAGRIELDGRVRRFSRPAESLAAGISMIYQELNLVGELSVAENLFLGREPRGKVPFVFDFGQMTEKTKELLQGFNFNLRPETKINDLSTADRQMVEIVKALTREAAIIVMDEPTSSLSRTETEKLLETIRTLRERGISVIYISHRLEEVAKIADDLTVLRDGKVVHSGPAKELTIDQIVRHMVGRELTEFFPARDVAPGEVRLKVAGLSSDKGIHGVGFEVRRGEVVGMAGLVGAGRTEVVKTIFGVDRLTAGSIEIDGVTVKIDSPHVAIRQGIALLTEDRKQSGLCLGLPAAWNITLPSLEKIGMKRFLYPGREKQIAAEMVGRISIKWAGPMAPAGSLSGGNQQKLLVARWLLAESRVIIFDEPTRGIDVAAKREVYGLVNQLAGAGKAIIIISSELEELLGMTDRIVVMRRGRPAGTLETRKTNPEEIMHLAAVEEPT
jgi:ABC-type sugar transport system ATPase subunit